MRKLIGLFVLTCMLYGCGDDTVTLPVELNLSAFTNLSIDENSADGTAITTISATVLNSSTTPTYTVLSQTPAGALGIDGDQLVVANSALLDYETITEVTGQIEARIGDVAVVGNFTVTVNNVNEPISIPDPNFKAKLVGNSSINTNNNTEIEESEAAAFTGIIAAQGSNIQSVAGIEHFVNVTRIALFNNLISSIDVSKNTKVTQLLLETNQLTSLDVSALAVLTDLKAHSNKLTSANIANGNNSRMTRMELQGNSTLTCIQVDAVADRSGWLKDSSASYSTNCN